MMQYLLMKWNHELEYEPYEVYCELDETRREKRRIELYKNGISFYYGGEGGKEEALSADPYPEDLRELNRDSGGEEDEIGECTFEIITANRFHAVWDQALERPNGFTGIYI